jgi:oligopeptide/dipeptide ABC transporter ATP-binding protein
MIEGHPPKQIGDVNSCTFTERCPWATEECKTVAPPLETPSVGANEGQEVACIRDREVYEDTLEENQ